MTLKSDVKFEEKLTCYLANDMRNLASFQQSTLKCQNWYYLKICRGVTCHDNEELYKD